MLNVNSRKDWYNRCNRNKGNKLLLQLCSYQKRFDFTLLRNIRKFCIHLSKLKTTCLIYGLYFEFFYEEFVYLHVDVEAIGRLGQVKILKWLRGFVHQNRREKRTTILLMLLLTLSACTIGILSTLTYTEFDCAALLAML